MLPVRIKRRQSLQQTQFQWKLNVYIRKVFNAKLKTSMNDSIPGESWTFVFHTGLTLGI